MSGEPTKPRSGDVEQTKADKSGSLPDSKSSTSDEIAAFVAKAKAMSPHADGARGRLIFALDATMSRQPTWDMACTLQADMFREAASLGSLDIRPSTIAASTSAAPARGFPTARSSQSS